MFVLFTISVPVAKFSQGIQVFPSPQNRTNISKYLLMDQVYGINKTKNHFGDVLSNYYYLFKLFHIC